MNKIQYSNDADKQAFIKKLNSEVLFNSRKMFGMHGNVQWLVEDIDDGELQVRISSSTRGKDGNSPSREEIAKNITKSIHNKLPEHKVNTYWADWVDEHGVGGLFVLGTDSEQLTQQVSERVGIRASNSFPLVYSMRVQDAIHFSIQVHEEPIKQKRKGKDVPYVTHPLTVALILSLSGACEDVVIAGILHDTIEDCEPYGSVTKELLADKFGDTVAELVDSVTEKDKSLDWNDRKEAALEEIKQFSNDALILKSADIISNNTELIMDYERDGEATFNRFNAPKEETIPHTLAVIEVLIDTWPDNPLKADLETVGLQLQQLNV